MYWIFIKPGNIAGLECYCSPVLDLIYMKYDLQTSSRIICFVARNENVSWFDNEQNFSQNLRSSRLRILFDEVSVFYTDKN